MKPIVDLIAEKIDFLDERFYKVAEDTYYPSVTYVLDVYHKGHGYTEWLKQVGFNAKAIVDRAADIGTRVHNAIEAFLIDGTLSWTDEDNQPLYSFDEWSMICKFYEFWTEFNPVVMQAEYIVTSDKYKLGGTMDLVCKIGADIWYIDNKTSNAIRDTHHIQAAAYVKMWNEANPKEQITRFGMLHLRGRSRGADKAGKTIQGKGWKIDEPKDSLDQLFAQYSAARTIWDKLNPNAKPKIFELPTIIKK